jgi:type II secretory pathway pseudopilin PulG
MKRNTICFSGFHARSGPRAFSLIEVVLSLGVVSFALLALIGLLPAGLGVQKSSLNESRSIQVLSQIAQAMQAIRRDEGSGVLEFPSPLGGLNVAPGAVELSLASDGTLSNNSTDSRGTIFIEQLPAPAGSPGLLPAYISVAWPASAKRSGGVWNNAEGSVETFIYVAVPD